MIAKNIAALTCIFLFIKTNFSSAQTADTIAAQTVSEVRFSEINDGVYFTLSDLQRNLPSISKEQLIKSYYDKSDFTLSQWAATQNLYYTDGEGVKRKTNRDSLWGYVENGTPFIFLNDRFHKFSTVGSISIFTESYPTMQVNIAPVVTDAKAGVFIRLFDFTTGEISDYNLENASRAIAKDEALISEFNEFKSTKLKKKKIYRFIERYNESHSIFSEN